MLAGAPWHAATSDRWPRIVLGELLGQGAHSAVHRGTLDELTVAVKLALEPARAGDDRLLTRFRREAAALGRLAGHGVPRAHESGVTSDGRPYIVLEYIDGITLRDRRSRFALEEREVLRIAHTLCGTLSRVHAHGLVHRDIKPHNVILRADGEPVLVDFGLVSECGARTGYVDRVAQAVGTFAYSAPEQTGMLARAVDGRADLYALGAVLYECLMAKPPFEAEDPGELLHLHATRPAPRIDTERYAEGTARVVARLLAKDPDDRFPDAASVARAIAGLLADPDVRSSAAQPQTLPEVRDQELGRLSTALDSAHAERIRLCVLSGDAGMGKTWLAEALARRATQQGFTVLYAPCRAEGDAPFGPFRRMFESYVGRGLAGPDAPEFRARIKRAASDYAPYLAQLAPCLRPCLDLKESDLALHGNHELLQQAVVEFIVALGPVPWLVIFEDAHLSDNASLEVLERLAQRTDARALWILCTLDTAHATGTKRVRRGPGRLAAEQLVLAPLSKRDVTTLLQRELGPDPFDDTLATMLTSMSGGNPRAVSSYLQAMIDGGVVRPCWERWCFESALLPRLALPTNVADLALERLARMSPATHETLRFAAVLDEPFTIPAWIELAESDAEPGVRAALAEALAEHVLLSESADSYRFAHVALRDKLGAELGAARPRLHLKLATFLEARPSDDAGALYAIATHHFRGVCKETAARAYDTNLRAAQHALGLFAFEQATALFEQARQIADAHGLEVCFRLCRGLAEAKIESGDVNSGLDLLELADACCSDPLERAEIQVYAGNTRFFQTGSTGALQGHLERAFRALGKPMPQESVGLALRAFGCLLLVVFYELTGLGRGSARRAREAYVHGSLYEFSGLLGMFRDAPALMLYSLFSGLIACWRLGDSRLLAQGSASGATAFSSIPLTRRFAARGFKRAYAVADALRDRPARAIVQYYEAIAHCFADRSVEGEQAMVECLRTQSSWLDTRALVTVAGTLVLHRLQRGYVDAALDVARRHVSLSQRHGRAKGSDTMGIGWTFAAEAIRGENDQTPALLPRLFEGLDDPEREPLRWLTSYAVLVGALLERGDCRVALKRAVDAAERGPMRPAFAPWMYGEAFVRCAEARYVLLSAALAEGSVDVPAHRAAFERSLERAVIAAKRHPIPVALCGALRAAKLRLDGDSEGALEELSRSEALAHRVDVPFAIYNIRMERARVLSDLGQVRGAEREAEAARALAEQMHWAGRKSTASTLLRSLKRMGHDAATRNAATGTLATQVTSGSAETSNLARDRAALLEVSLALAGEIEPGAQAIVALDTLLRLLSAERAFIFEHDDERGLTLIAARDAEGNDLDASSPIARSLLERCCTRREPLVMSGTEEGAALGSESVVAQSLRSNICAPLILRDRLVGTVYLDSRLAKGMFTPHHLDILVAIANHIAVSQTMAHAAQREAERRALAKDLQLAAAVQGLILPRESELLRGGYGLASQYLPATHIGGDFWHLDTRDGITRVLIADVTGHGAGSAMVAACVAGLYRAYLRCGRGFEHNLIASLHQDLVEMCHGQYGMTLSVLELGSEGRVRWINAGGPPILVRRADGSIDLLSVSGTPLGGDELKLGETQFELARSEAVLLFSDGLYEMRMNDGRELGMSRLRRMLRRTQATNARELRDRIQEALAQVRGQTALDDDQTLVVCMREV